MKSVSHQKYVLELTLYCLSLCAAFRVSFAGDGAVRVEDYFVGDTLFCHGFCFKLYRSHLTPSYGTFPI